MIKLNFIDRSIKKFSGLNKNRIFFTRARNCLVTDTMVGKTFKIYNGLQYFDLTIVPDMISFKLGDFIFTKSMGHFIHNENRLQTKKRKKAFISKKKKSVIKKKKIIKKKK